MSAQARDSLTFDFIGVTQQNTSLESVSMMGPCVAVQSDTEAIMQPLYLLRW